MCGIAGYIGNKKLNSFHINNAFKYLYHRGPDSKGQKSLSLGALNVSFIHTRLSILDLNVRSEQPFSYKDNYIIFNGELYNYLEVKDKLKKLGYKFNTSGDTEVILAAYEYYGKECVNYFEGMWSFAIYDHKNKEIFISRDRFGEKPLLFHYNGNELFFASESKTLISLMAGNTSINDYYIKNYLSNGFRWLFKSDHTPYKNVNRLNSGENLIIDSNMNIKRYKYWLPKFNESTLKKSDIIEGAQYYLNKSLKLRMRSDVPIAFCLSGGIDSGSLVSLNQKLYNERIDTFSIIDSDERYNEQAEIDYLTTSLNINNYQTKLNNNNFMHNFKELINHHNEPVATVSYYIHSFLQKMISEKGYKVVISGTGADELFAGYYDHSLYWLAETYSENTIDARIKEWESNIGKFIQNKELKNPLKFIEDRTVRNYLYDSNEVLNNLLYSNEIEEFKEVKYTDNLLKNRMANELLNEVVPVILDQDDKNSMMQSIENRSPFLDTDLVNFAYSIPTDYLFNKGFSKSILREAVKGILPERIRLNKEKKGFNASIKTLLNLKDEKVRNELLVDSPIFDFVDRKRFEDYLNLDQVNPMFSKFLFRFISCKFFLESV